ncbi:MAG: hypothetical protein ACKO23_11900, partial [Gemmataceae bacterium]
VYLDELSKQTSIDIQGGMGLKLPVYFPTEITPLDPTKPNIEVNVNLATLETTTVFPDFAKVQDSFNLVDQLGSMADGWSGFFDRLDGVVRSQVFANAVPLIGKQLAQAFRIFADLRTAGVSNLLELGNKNALFVQQKIFEALGPGGLKWLKDITGDGEITLRDVKVTSQKDEVFFEVQLGQTSTVLNNDLNFDIGLDKLGLSLDGKVKLETSFDMGLKVGVTRSGGFFIDTGVFAQDKDGKALALIGNQKADMRFEVKATIPGLAATGKLGFLRVEAKDSSSDPSLFKGTFAIDIKDPSGDGKLYLDEILTSSVDSLIDARLNAYTKVNLDLNAGFGGENFPSVRSGLHLDWSFIDADTKTGVKDFGSAPQISFSGVKFDPGEAVRRFLNPILNKINQVLGPIRPIIKTLTSPLPVFSDLRVQISLLDIAKMSGYVPKEAIFFIKALGEVVKLIELTEKVVSGQFDVSLEGFKLSTGDLRQTS